MKRYGLLIMLALSACNENLSHTPPPMDHFFFPSGLALTPVAGGNQQALLVVSANFDLRYDKAAGATLLSVDPSVYDTASTTGGSAGRPGGALVKYGSGAQMGSYAGPVAVADSTTCPTLADGPEAFVASRYTRGLYRFPIGAEGAVDPCPAGGAGCEIALDADLLDPAAVGVACRTDNRRQSLFVGYLRSPTLGIYGAGTAWLSEINIGDLSAPTRTIALGPGPVGDMAYDALADRLYAVGRFAGLMAPLFILDLSPCSYGGPGDSTCANPRLQSVDLFGSLAGAELVSIALSNPQPGIPRRAYIAARVYDPAYAAAIRSRPIYDVGGALLVVDIQDDVIGQPAARVLAVVPIGLGAGVVRVLPVRPGLADLVVVPSAGDGTIQIYDDEVGAVVREVSVDQVTGAPEAGHVPSATAVECSQTDALGCTEALVYIASFRDWTVSVLRVPMGNPTSADLLRDTSRKPLRIGSPQP
jgi:hypothetical protein